MDGRGQARATLYRYTGMRARVALIVLVAALIVGTGVALLLANTVGLRDNADQTLTYDAYTLRTVRVESLIIDMETGLRGYVITGRSLFLSPMREAQAMLPGALTKLGQSARQTGAFGRQVRSLAAEVDVYTGHYAPGVLALAARHLRSAQSVPVTLLGKDIVDVIRSRAARLESLVSKRQNARQAAARSSATSSIAEAILVLVLLTGLTIVIGATLGRLALAREEALGRSEETSTTLQESLVPTTLPQPTRCEIASRFLPAAGLVGGDFYDVFALADGRWGVIIGDVCGKGAVAASITAMARWRLRGTLEAGATPEQALRALNAAMLRQGHDRRFVTVACMTLNPGADGAELELACAGHPAPLLVPRNGPPHPLDAEGDLLGIMAEVRLRSTTTSLRPGESLVAYTDGVFDQGPEVRPAPEQALGAAVAGATAEELAAALEAVALSQPGPHRDDIAILAVRFVGDPELVPPPPGSVLVTQDASHV